MKNLIHYSRLDTETVEAGRTKKLDSRLILFIDEAHNYVPSVYKSYCKEEILRIAREGRKYGLTLCLISQRPRWVDPKALSQCGNIFIFRIQNSEDKKHVFDSASLPDSLKSANIGRLRTGEMIIAGDIAEIPMSCTVSEIDRNAGYPAPAAQIPACATNALGSWLRI